LIWRGIKVCEPDRESVIKKDEDQSPGHPHPDHLKNQVLNFTKDLLELTEKFVNRIQEPEFRGIVQTAFDDALVEARKTADEYGIPNPL